MNLLPSAEKEILRKNLKTRSLILTSFLVSISFLAGLIMLLPAYFLALSNYSEMAYEHPLSKTEDETTVAEILGIPSEIDSKLKFMQLSNETSSVTELIADIARQVPPKVKLNSIALNKNKNYEGKIGTIIIASGTAADRNALVAFSSLLRDSGQFTAVEVPVSNLTKDKDLPFSVSLFIEE